ncbi:hypothetical protein HOY80DRAFT_998941 [Tuber brumale]|nr:hypothetical protein HOY80DRAFT_998941 [Tuber brumale]
MTEEEGDEFTDGPARSESESGDDDHVESVANLPVEGQILEDVTQLANVPEIVPSVPSIVNSPKELHEKDLNQWKTPNEYNFCRSSTCDKNTTEHLVLTISPPEVGQSLNPIASNEQPKSSQSVV